MPCSTRRQLIVSLSIVKPSWSFKMNGKDCENKVNSFLVSIVMFLIWLNRSAVLAIEIQPHPEQIMNALERGQAAAAERTPPDRLYHWFGPVGELTAHGFLMSKLDGLAVMSTHFALRGQHPSAQEQNQILADPYLMMSIILFGERSDFAVDSYVLLTQSDRQIPPVRVRFDGTAARSSAWPKSPAYRAKIIAFFAYTDFDARAPSRLLVFPRGGGEISFELNFAAIE
jgi:hypothetical protein